MKNLKSVSVQVIDSDIALLLPNGVYEIKQMEPKSSRLRRIGYFCVALALFGIVGLGYFCPDKVRNVFIHESDDRLLSSSRYVPLATKKHPYH